MSFFRISRQQVQEAIERVAKDGAVSPTERFGLIAWSKSERFDEDAAHALADYLASPAATPSSEAAWHAEGLFTAAATGGIDKAEYREVIRNVTAKYGRKQGTEALALVFGRHEKELTSDALASMGEKSATRMGAAIRVMTDQTPGTRVIDTNLDNELDEGDLVVQKDSIKTLDTPAVDEVRIARSIADAAKAMDKAAHSFAIIEDTKFNAALWNKESPAVFTIKPDVKPSDAVRDIFAHPKLYAFECATAMVIIYYKATLDLLGDEKFNALTEGLTIGPWVMDDDVSTTRSFTGSGQAEADKGFAKSLRPGDYAYIRNWDVSEQGFKAGWQGENVLYVGHGRFYGHPFGIKTEREIVESLNTTRKEGSTHSASFTDVRGVFHPRLPERPKPW